MQSHERSAEQRRERGGGLGDAPLGPGHSAGRRGATVDDFHCPMPMGTSIDDTVTFMQGTDMAAMLLAGVADDVAARAWDAVRSALAPHTGAEGVVLNGATWSVTATKP
jgi:hypothetical protein